LAQPDLSKYKKERGREREEERLQKVTSTEEERRLGFWAKVLAENKQKFGLDYSEQTSRVHWK